MKTPPFVGCLVKSNHPMIAGVSSLTLIVARLRSLRERHQLSQEQFAESAGISYKFYQSIEAGRRKQIWLETVDRLAAGFGLETWQLIAPGEPAQTTVHRRTSNEAFAGHKAVAESAALYRVKSGRKQTRAKRTRKKAAQP